MNKIINILLACMLNATFAVASTYNLRVEITPNGSGTLNMSSGMYEQDASIYLKTSSHSGYVFKGWFDNDSLLSTSKNFYYTMPARDAVLQARYEFDPDVPDNPAMPDTVTYYSFSADILPTGAGTLNIYSGKYTEGANIGLKANTHSGYHFICWINEKGDTLSTSKNYKYKMPQGNARLTALYYYDPIVPINPDSMGVKRMVTVECKPVGSATFNTAKTTVTAGNSLHIYSYTNSGYRFLYWENEKGDTLSKQSDFYYTVPDKDSKLYGVFEYDPTSPENPNKFYWDKTSGEVVISEFTIGKLSSAVSLAVSGSNNVVKKLTVTGNMNSNDFGIANSYTNCAVLDLSRVTGVNEIPSYAFDKTNLVATYLPSTVKSIESNAFLKCEKLEYVTIPETVTSIGNKAFSGCSRLESVVSYIPKENLFAISNTIFDGVDKNNCILYVPKGAVETYKATDGWSDFKKITEINSLKKDSDGFYMLGSLREWQEFSLFAQVNTIACARMTNDINLADDATMIGTLQVPFEGIFDGNGHTLVVAYSSSEEYVAPFRHAKNAKIENLRLSGSIETNNKAVGGIVAMVSGDNETIIRNCWSSVSLASGTGKNGNLIGGLTSSNYGKLVIEDCLFDGCISETNNELNAGFVASNHKELTIRNSLNVGTYTCTSTSDCGTFYRNDNSGCTVLLENVYFQKAYGTEQGVLAAKEQLADNTILNYLQNNRSESIWVQTNSSPTPLLTDGSEFKQISQEEWGILKKIYAAMEEGKGWRTPWNFSAVDRNTSYVPGVTLKDGHVVAVDLSDNNITGGFPVELLELPHLKFIDLSDNKLGGYIDGVIQYGAASLESIADIDISNNEFKGNIGLFANAFPNLRRLNASNNRLEDVNPKISPKVIDLQIDSQFVERIMDWNLTGFAVENLIGQLPSIVSYNHIKQNYSLPINLYIEGKDNWGINVLHYDGNSYGPYLSEQNAYKNESGDTLTVHTMDVYDTSTGTKLCLKIEFDIADANFDGHVDVLDLQAILLYIYGHYKDRFFNHTAADTYRDSSINVQDVVVMVNMLLEKMDSTVNSEYSLASNEFSNEINMSPACIYKKGDLIILRSDVPVAALSIKANGDVKWNLDKYGMVQSTLSSNVVGYYLNSNTLPVNKEIVLGEGRNVVIHTAKLSDISADKIYVDIYNDNPTSVDSVNDSDDEVYDVYDMSGVKIDILIKGMNIVKDKNGFKKVFKK